jgi:hypothetical protein
MPQYWTLDTPEQITAFLAERDKRAAVGEHTVVSFDKSVGPGETTESPHTPAQNNAIHLWIRQSVKVFNDNGIEKHLFLEKLYASTSLTGIWTEEAFKEDTYKPLYRAVTGKESTTKASTTDHDACITALTKWVAEHYDGLLLPPHPDRFTQGQE